MPLKMYTGVKLYCPFLEQALISGALQTPPVTVNPIPHVTMSFQDAGPTGCITVDMLDGPLPSSFLVIAVEYWEGPNVTVAVLDPEQFKEARECYDRIGLTYTDYPFKPHATLCKGNHVDLLQPLVGKQFMNMDTYIRLKEFK